MAGSPTCCNENIDGTQEFNIAATALQMRTARYRIRRAHTWMRLLEYAEPRAWLLGTGLGIVAMRAAAEEARITQLVKIRQTPNGGTLRFRRFLPSPRISPVGH